MHDLSRSRRAHTVILLGSIDSSLNLRFGLRSEVPCVLYCRLVEPMLTRTKGELSNAAATAMSFLPVRAPVCLQTSPLPSNTNIVAGTYDGRSLRFAKKIQTQQELLKSVHGAYLSYTSTCHLLSTSTGSPRIHQVAVYTRLWTSKSPLDLVLEHLRSI